MVEFRAFHNRDVPGIVHVWNTAGLGRGAATGVSHDEFEVLVFAQPYFDPQGLIIAEDEGKIVGFAHAGFGGAADTAVLEYHRGVICAVLVAPTHRRRGIGRQLVERAEDYLRRKGATAIFAGPAAPLNPFYFGLYGGSECAGFLDSDPLAAPFFLGLGYEPRLRYLVFQREIGGKGDPVNLRLMSIRRATRLGIVQSARADDWWWTTHQGRLDTVELGLAPKNSSETMAQVVVGGLELYANAWRARGMGLTGLFVAPEHRRKGYAQALLCEVCRRVKDEAISLVESHTLETNVAGTSALKSAGFKVVDAGTVFQKRSA